MTTRRAICILLAACLPGACSGGRGAGYTLSGAYPSDISTVAVEMFRNDTYEVGLEAELAEAIVKEMQRVTPWAVTSAQRAEARLTGEVRSVDLRAVSVQRGTGLTQELAYRITVNFRFEDARSGEPRVVRLGFTGQETFVPVRGTGDRIGVGRSGAINRLAQEIVAQLRSDF
ncbi:MAG: LPS assembly lipoprotein LptE [Phycisphaerales bacterium JB039]